MDKSNFKNALKSSQYCYDFPTMCWTLIAINELGDAAAENTAFMIFLGILICCGLGYVMFQVLNNLFPDAINRIIPRCIRSESTHRCLNTSSSLQRLLSGIDNLLNRLGNGNGSNISLANGSARSTRTPLVRENREELFRDNPIHIGDGVNEAENFELSMLTNRALAGEDAAEAVEIPVPLSLSTGDVDMETASGTAAGTTDENINHVDIEAPNASKRNTTKEPKAKEETARKVSTNQRSKSLSRNNRQAQGGNDTEDELNTDLTPSERTWKY